MGDSCDWQVFAAATDSKSGIDTRREAPTDAQWLPQAGTSRLQMVFRSSLAIDTSLLIPKGVFLDRENRLTRGVILSLL